MKQAAFLTHYDTEPLATGTHKGVNGSPSLYNPDALFMTCGITAGLAIEKVALNPSEMTYLTSDGEELVDDGDTLLLTEDESADESGLVTSATDNTVLASGITRWEYGDTYNIYKTATKGSFISRIATDRLFGKKVTKPSELNNYGWIPEDADLDRDEDGLMVKRKDRPFGPGQPERTRRRYK